MDAARRHAELLEIHGQSTEAALAAVLARPEMVSTTGSAVVRYLTPLYLSDDDFAAAAVVAETLSRALGKVAKHVGDPELAAAMRLPPLDARHRALLALGAPPFVSRVDLLTGPLHRPLEFNGTSGSALPGLMLETERVTRALWATPLMTEMRRHFRLRGCTPVAHLLDELRRRKDELQRQGPPVITVLIPPPGYDFRSSLSPAEPPEFGVREPTVALMRHFTLMSHLTEEGCVVQLATPQELDYRGGRLSRGGLAVDFLLGATNLLADCADDDPLLQAVLSGDVDTLDGYPSGWLLSQKQLFAALSDPSWARLFGEEDASALHRIVPWTRVMAPGRTTHERETVDLVDFVRSERERLVLKPFYAAGGHGVRLGWEMEQRDWEAALQVALQRPHVVQERVEGARARFARAGGDASLSDELSFDLNPYVWQGSRARECLVRVAESSTMNVSAGGSMVPAVFVEAA